MSADRAHRRQRKRQLLQQGEAALKHGLALQPTREAVVGLALLLRETLADTASADRASRAAEIAHKVFEASLRAAPSKLDIACRKGCGYCCHSWVAATAPEIFLLARTVRAIKPASSWMHKDAILERAALTAGLSIAERFGRKLPCALLADDACGMYGVRPTVCRQVTSTDLAACIDEYDGRDFDGDIVVSQVYLDHARSCRIPLQAALAALGLPMHSYELTAGLTAACASAAQGLWLSGSDPFADVAKAPDEPAPILQLIRTVAADITGL